MSDRCDICGYDSVGVLVDDYNGKSLFICHMCIQDMLDAISELNPLSAGDNEGMDD